MNKLKMTLVLMCIFAMPVMGYSQKVNTYRFKLSEVSSKETSDIAREKLSGYFGREPIYDESSNNFVLNTQEVIDFNMIYDKLLYVNLTVSEFETIDIQETNILKQ